MRATANLAPRSIPESHSVSAAESPNRSGFANSLADLQAFLDSGSSADRQAIGHTPAMLHLLQQAREFARSSATVLLTGESGTGKEVIAKLIHQASPRSSGPYVRVNCAALCENLLESELFGHERGAFTGAVSRRAGRFESADGGTLLLDEISEIPIHLQAKLLRVLEEEEYQRVGGSESHRVNVRIVATTNRRLEEEIDIGNFREDLFYRINVLQLDLPPLRQRAEDVTALVHHFIGLFRDEAKTPVQEISAGALAVLCSYRWPGNVRQLRNVIHRACVISNRGKIDVTDLPPLESATVSDSEAYENMRLEEVERHVILASLRRFNGNKAAAARHLGVTARTLRNKMHRYRESGYAPT